MKKFVSDFFRRGLSSCGLGPVILAVVYLILHKNSVVETLTVNQVCSGIFSLTVLAFIAGGINAIYQLESLPLMPAILIHGVTLYVCYLATYLLNDWIERRLTAVLIFSAIFVGGYLIIWAIIYCITKRNTAKLNKILKEKQQKDSKAEILS